LLRISTAFKAELEKLIQQAINDQVEVITARESVIDFPSYKYHVGLIAGLKMAQELSDEAESIINKRERGV
jgi:hypothetical protein